MDGSGKGILWERVDGRGEPPRDIEEDERELVEKKLCVEIKGEQGRKMRKGY